MNPTSAEIALIGAGPIGLEIAVALKKSGFDYLHFDSRQIGYTISWFAPQTRFFSSNERIAIAGVPLFTSDQSKCSRELYLAYLRSVVQEFDLKIHTYEPVVEIHRDRDEFTLTTRRGGHPQKYRARKLIFATGGTERPRPFDVPGANLSHVTRYFQDPHAYFQKDLLIVGGRNSAVEAALRCHYAGARVTISYRKPQFDSASIKYWLWPEMNGLIESGKIKAHFNSTVKEIHPGKTVLQSTDGKQTQIPADFVLALIGYEADMSLLRMAGIDLKNPGEIPAFNPATMETNIPGTYVAGTAIAGTQARYQIFIENCHVHADRILASLTSQSPPPAPTQFDRPES
jgi:thioredoxin reductase (NADPH)